MADRYFEKQVFRDHWILKRVNLLKTGGKKNSIVILSYTVGRRN